MYIEAYFKAKKEFEDAQRDIFKKLGVSYLENKLEEGYFIKNKTIIFGEDDYFSFQSDFTLDTEFHVYVDKSDSTYKTAYVVRKSNQYVKVGG